MAKPKPPKPPGGGKKKPKISPATIKQDLRAAIRAEMDNIKRQKGLDLLYLNKALGVGDMKAFGREWEKTFAKSTPLRKLTKEQKAIEEQIKPKLTKVSVEYKPTKKGGK
jgi:hypothetical protein